MSSDSKRHKSPYLRDKLQSGLYSFITHESFGGVLLFFCVALAMIVANTHLSSHYFAFWNTELSFSINDSKKSITLLHLINDILMSFFFLMVGLEMKREVLYGDLSGFKKVNFSFFAALGGIIIPILIYMIFNHSNDGYDGFGVVMSTDTAFVLGVILFLGSRIPNVIKIFLVTLAVVDDLGSVLVVAIFYTDQIHIPWIYVSVLILALLTYINYKDTKHIFLYLALGVLLWLAVYKSGIHPTVAAVLLSFFIPGKSIVTSMYFEKMMNEWNKIDFDEIRQWREDLHERKKKSFLKSIASGMKNFLDPSAQKQVDIVRASYYAHVLDKIGTYSERAQNPLLKIEHYLQPICAYFIVPIFAFANAGVTISQDLDLFSQKITYGVIFGLVIGKPIGIFIFAYLSEKIKIAERPKGLSLGHILGVGALAGIGFTMSMFVSTLAYDDAILVDISKLSVLLASLISCLIGVVILALSTKSAKKSPEE